MSDLTSSVVLDWGISNPVEISVRVSGFWTMPNSSKSASVRCDDFIRPFVIRSAAIFRAIILLLF